MKVYLISLFFTYFACKMDKPTEANSSEKYTKIQTASGASLDKDPDPIMGGPTHLKITINDHKTSGVAKIYGFYSDQNYLADSVMYKDGIIEYKNPKGMAQGLYYIGISGRNEMLQFILGKDQEMEATVSLADILNTMTIVGNEENTLMYENFRYEGQLTPRIKELDAKLKTLNSASPDYATVKTNRDKLETERLTTIVNLKNKYPEYLFPAYKSAGQNPKINYSLPENQQVIQFRNQFWDNVDFADTRLLHTPVIGNKLKRYIKELTLQNPDSIVSSGTFLVDKVLNKPEYFKVFANYIVLSYEPGKSTVMDSENIFVSMVQKYFTPERAYWSSKLETDAIQQRASEMAASLLGKKAPNVISTDQFGKKQELLAKTSDYLIVYMFNPDCEHCKEQTPKLLKYWLENKDKGVDVFAIAIDTEDDKWKNYIKTYNLSWTNVHDPTNRSIYGKYFVDVTPEIYVINKDRIIIGKNLKSDQIQTIIDRDKQKRAK